MSPTGRPKGKFRSAQHDGTPVNLTGCLAALACAAAFGPQAAQGAPFAIDPTHTFVSFEIDATGLSTSRGRFNRKEGSVEFDRAARTGRVEIVIDMTSISTGVAAFDRQLQGDDAFDVARHPQARFVGEQFVFDGERVRSVIGTLTLLGITAPVTLTASHFDCYQNPLFQREVCGGDFKTTLQRSRWGMSWGPQQGIADAVRLLIQIEAIQQ